MILQCFAQNAEPIFLIHNAPLRCRRSSNGIIGLVKASCYRAKMFLLAIRAESEPEFLTAVVSYSAAHYPMAGLD